MKLAQLFAIYPQLKWGDFPMAEVKQICDDSREVGEGSVFIAVRGQSFDGHRFLPDVCTKGAVAVVVEDESLIPKLYKGAVVRVQDTREALNNLASRFYGEPARQLFCVGVTGTNGKTSTTYFIEELLTRFGWASGVMGTIDHHLGKHKWETTLTTPGALALHRRLQEFVSLGAKAAVFEVSSHALSQFRADHIPFDVVVFTNLSRDHLDYHKDMEQYFASKHRLFNDIPLNFSDKQVHAVINTDDKYGQRIQVADKVKRVTYGQGPADFQFKVLSSSFSGTRFLLSCSRGEREINLGVPGEHNVYNAVAAVAVAILAGASLESVAEALENFKGVPGRLQRVANPLDISIFVDYAHTDDALREVLIGLRKIRQQMPRESRIITVFGCGGDRDKGKRPIMMSVAKELSDIVVVTSDNPRNESPQDIIRDILTVVLPNELDHNVFVQEDRRQAIKQAISMARAGDVVLIAGKGHESHQVIGQQRLEFSDAKVAKEIVVELSI